MFVKAYDAIHTVRHNFPILQIRNETCLSRWRKSHALSLPLSDTRFVWNKIIWYTVTQIVIDIRSIFMSIHLSRKWILMVIHYIRYFTLSCHIYEFHIKLEMRPQLQFQIWLNIHYIVKAFNLNEILNSIIHRIITGLWFV